MKENLYLTENSNSSTLHNIDSGLVLSISDNNPYAVWVATPIAWVNAEKSFFTSFSEVQSALGQTGIFTPTGLVSNGTYVICLSEHTSTVQVTIMAVANALEYNSYFSPIILNQ